MIIEVTDPLPVAILLTIVLLVAFTVVYGASRMAISDARQQPVFAARAVAHDDRVHFKLANLGVVPAFRVQVTWLGQLRTTGRAEMLATTDVLGPLDPLEWDVVAAAVPGEQMVARGLAIEWRSNAYEWSSARHGSTDLLVPSRVALAPASPSAAVPETSTG